jgi:hypothetical protein
VSQDFKVVKGSPDPQELAAVIMVITAQAAQKAQTEGRTSLRPEWNAAHRGVRKSFEHGAGTWRRSALPHPY